MTDIISPCIGICTLQYGVCIGCSRTASEIKYWTSYSEKQRNLIMETLNERQRESRKKI